MNVDFKNMIDWNIFQSPWNVIWDDPIGWYLNLPLFGQVLLIIGLIALTILALILVYYILKGVGYLLYYLFKGIYYLLKFLFLGIYKLFEALYYAITGKPRKEKKEPPKITEIQAIPNIYNKSFIVKDNIKIPSYCTECGQKTTESQGQLLISTGIAHCYYCGKEFKLRTL